MSTAQRDIQGPAFGAFHAHGQRCRYSALADNGDCTGDRSGCTWTATCTRCGMLFVWEQDLRDRNAIPKIVAVVPQRKPVR